MPKNRWGYDGIELFDPKIAFALFVHNKQILKPEETREMREFKNFYMKFKIREVINEIPDYFTKDKKPEEVAEEIASRLTKKIEESEKEITPQ